MGRFAGVIRSGRLGIFVIRSFRLVGVIRSGSRLARLIRQCRFYRCCSSQCMHFARFSDWQIVSAARLADRNRSEQVARLTD